MFIVLIKLLVTSPKAKGYHDHPQPSSKSTGIALKKKMQSKKAARSNGILAGNSNGQTRMSQNGHHSLLLAGQFGSPQKQFFPGPQQVCKRSL